jgi:hypothetical protein
VGVVVGDNVLVGVIDLVVVTVEVEDADGETVVLTELEWVNDIVLDGVDEGDIVAEDDGEYDGVGVEVKVGVTVDGIVPVFEDDGVNDLVLV